MDFSISFLFNFRLLDSNQIQNVSEGVFSNLTRLQFLCVLNSEPVFKILPIIKLGKLNLKGRYRLVVLSSLLPSI